MREILQARIRDPGTSARDLASLVNSLAKLDEEQEAAERPSILHHRIGTLINKTAALGGKTVCRSPSSSGSDCAAQRPGDT